MSKEHRKRLEEMGKEEADGAEAGKKCSEDPRSWVDEAPMDTSAQAREALHRLAAASGMGEQGNGASMGRQGDENEQRKKPEEPMSTNERVETALTSSLVMSEPFALAPRHPTELPPSAIPTTVTALAATDIAAAVGAVSGVCEGRDDEQGRDGGAGGYSGAAAAATTATAAGDGGSVVVRGHRGLTMSEFTFIEGGKGGNGKLDVRGGVGEASEGDDGEGRDRNMSRTSRVQKASRPFSRSASSDFWVSSCLCVFMCVCVNLPVFRSLSRLISPVLVFH